MKSASVKRFLYAHFSLFILVTIAILLIISAYWFARAYQAIQFNNAVANGTIISQSVDRDNSLQAYSIAYLLEQQGEYKQAGEALEIAEVTADPDLKSKVKFAIANQYFRKMVADLGKEHGSRRIVEKVILAREAYKSALRLQPDLYPARFNLELLDRLSPEKRTQGVNTGDGYTYKISPLQQDGRMHMKENIIRGLP